MSMTRDIDASRIRFFFIFSGKHILTRQPSGEDLNLPDISLFKNFIESESYIDWFTEPELGYAAMKLKPEQVLPAGCRLVPLRELFAADQETSPVAVRAKGITEWRQNARFCSTCGTPLTDSTMNTSRYCSCCRTEIFPQIAPCIIVLVEKDGELLLARHAQRNTDMFTCLAGYMEPGETIEECVKREILEETGISVKDVRYVKSQSWPFPNQLMIGFHAEYGSGSIKVQEEEIQEARWFRRDELPQIPAPGSLAWELITGRI